MGAFFTKAFGCGIRDVDEGEIKLKDEERREKKRQQKELEIDLILNRVIDGKMNKIYKGDQSSDSKFIVDKVTAHYGKSLIDESLIGTPGRKPKPRQVPLNKIVRVEDIFDKNIAFFKEPSVLDENQNELPAMAAQNIVPKPEENIADELSADSEEEWSIDDDFVIDQKRNSYRESQIGGPLLFKPKQQVEKEAKDTVVHKRLPLSGKKFVQKLKEVEPDLGAVEQFDNEFNSIEAPSQVAVQKEVNDAEMQQQQIVTDQNIPGLSPPGQVKFPGKKEPKQVQVTPIKETEPENYDEIAEKLTAAVFEDRISLAFGAFKTATQRELFDGPSRHGPSENLLPQIFDFTFGKVFDFDKDELRNFATNFNPTALASVFAKVAADFSKCDKCFLPFRVNGLKWKSGPIRLGGKKDDISVIFNILLDLKPPSDEAIQEIVSQLHKKEDTVSAALKAHVGLFMDYYGED